MYKYYMACIVAYDCIFETYYSGSLQIEDIAFILYYYTGCACACERLVCRLATVLLAATRTTPLCG